jgi:hypothetical protein
MITANDLLDIFQDQCKDNDNQVFPPRLDDSSVIIDGEFDFQAIARAINKLQERT